MSVCRTVCASTVCNVMLWASAEVGPVHSRVRARSSHVQAQQCVCVCVYCMCMYMCPSVCWLGASGFPVLEPQSGEAERRVGCIAAHGHLPLAEVNEVESTSASEQATDEWGHSKGCHAPSLSLSFSLSDLPMCVFSSLRSAWLKVFYVHSIEFICIYPVSQATA